MSDSLDEILAELEQFGRTNDLAVSERSQRMLNITHDTGEFLVVLIRAMRAQRVLEIGRLGGDIQVCTVGADHSAGTSGIIFGSDSAGGFFNVKRYINWPKCTTS